MNSTSMTNVQPIQPRNRRIAAAALQLICWIDAGVALFSEREIAAMTARPSPPKRLGAEYPAFTQRQAILSLERARRQFAKGNLTPSDMGEIERRCGWAREEQE